MGSYECQCQPGFKGDGFQCSGDSLGLRIIASMRLINTIALNIRN